MLATIPFNLEKIPKADLDKELLRTAIIAELDAVNLYEQMAHLATGKGLKTLFLDIVREEKTHVGEFQALLLQVDKEQEHELVRGREEVEELLK
ncbi:MAG: rubrerythrin [Deltaproteobacteria bacterium RIFOXYD12_FULL_53_23]|nr:MAG: rubrerythrin [Deltaproteobacteria bacterium RIFOXYD12_FULL_53_23]